MNSSVLSGDIDYVCEVGNLLAFFKLFISVSTAKGGCMPGQVAPHSYLSSIFWAAGDCGFFCNALQTISLSILSNQKTHREGVSRWNPSFGALFFLCPSLFSRPPRVRGFVDLDSFNLRYFQDLAVLSRYTSIHTRMRPLRNAHRLNAPGGPNSW